MNNTGMNNEKHFPKGLVLGCDLGGTTVYSPGQCKLNKNLKDVAQSYYIQKINGNQIESEPEYDASYVDPTMLSFETGFETLVNNACLAAQERAAASFEIPSADEKNKLPAGCKYHFTESMRKALIEWEGMVATVALSGIYEANGLDLSIRVGNFSDGSNIDTDVADGKYSVVKAEAQLLNQSMQRALREKGTPNCIYLLHDGKIFGQYNKELGVIPVQTYDCTMLNFLPWYQSCGIGQQHRSWLPIMGKEKSNYKWVDLSDGELRRIVFWLQQQQTSTPVQYFLDVLCTKLGISPQTKLAGTYKNYKKQIPCDAGTASILRKLNPQLTDENVANWYTVAGARQSGKDLPNFFTDKMLLTWCGEECGLVVNCYEESPAAKGQQVSKPLKFDQWIQTEEKFDAGTGKWTAASKVEFDTITAQGLDHGLSLLRPVAPLTREAAKLLCGPEEIYLNNLQFEVYHEPRGDGRDRFRMNVHVILSLWVENDLLKLEKVYTNETAYFNDGPGSSEVAEEIRHDLLTVCLPDVEMMPGGNLQFEPSFWKRSFATWKEIPDSKYDIKIQKMMEMVETLERFSVIPLFDGGAVEWAKDRLGGSERWGVTTAAQPLQFASLLYGSERMSKWLMDSTKPEDAEQLYRFFTDVSGTGKAEAAKDYGTVFVPVAQKDPKFKVDRNRAATVNIDFGTTSTVFAISETNGPLTLGTFELKVNSCLTISTQRSRWDISSLRWTPIIAEKDQPREGKILTVAQLFETASAASAGVTNRVPYEYGRYCVLDVRTLNDLRGNTAQNDYISARGIYSNLKFGTLPKNATQEQIDKRDAEEKATEVFMANVLVEAIAQTLQLGIGSIHFRCAYPSEASLEYLETHWDHAMAIATSFFDAVFDPNDSTKAICIDKGIEYYLEAEAAAEQNAKGVHHPVINVDIGGGTTDISMYYDKEYEPVDSVSVRYAGRQLTVESIVQAYRVWDDGQNETVRAEHNEERKKAFCYLWDGNGADKTMSAAIRDIWNEKLSKTIDVYAKQGDIQKYVDYLRGDDSIREQIEVLLSRYELHFDAMDHPSHALLCQLIRTKVFLLLTAVAEYTKACVKKNPNLFRPMGEDSYAVDVYLCGTGAKAVVLAFSGVGPSQINKINGIKVGTNGNTQLMDHCLETMNRIFEHVIGQKVEVSLSLNAANVNAKTDVCYGMSHLPSTKKHVWKALAANPGMTTAEKDQWRAEQAKQRRQDIEAMENKLRTFLQNKENLLELMNEVDTRIVWDETLYEGMKDEKLPLNHREQVGFDAAKPFIAGLMEPRLTGTALNGLAANGATFDSNVVSYLVDCRGRGDYEKIFAYIYLLDSFLNFNLAQMQKNGKCAKMNNYNQLEKELLEYQKELKQQKEEQKQQKAEQPEERPAETVKTAPPKVRKPRAAAKKEWHPDVTGWYCEGPEHHTCPEGANFCMKCGKNARKYEAVSEEWSPEVSGWYCDGSEHHTCPEGANFCMKCGKPVRWYEVTPKEWYPEVSGWYCEGDEHHACPEGANFCMKCGKPVHRYEPLGDEWHPAVSGWYCEDDEHHACAADASFCMKCGKPVKWYNGGSEDLDWQPDETGYYCEGPDHHQADGGEYLCEECGRKVRLYRGRNDTE